MKVNRKGAAKTNTETFLAQLLFTKSDVRNALLLDIAESIGDDAMTQDFWTDFLGSMLSLFGADRKPLTTLKEPLGIWAFALAKRYAYLKPDLDENLFYRDKKLLLQSRQGVTAKSLNDDE